MAKIFISYSRADKAFAADLYRGLSDAGFKPWLDLFDIPPAYPVLQAIQEGIRTSDLLVVLISPAALKSNWVKKELNIAAQCQLSNIGVKVLPVLLSGIRCNDLPTRLQRINCIDDVEGANGVVGQISRILDDLPIRVFLGPDIGRYNVAYYHYLNARIREATQEIWITGCGFNCSDGNPNGKLHADNMIAALQDRLRNQVRVIRVQTGPTIDDYWASQIVGLAKKYPTLMTLWRLADRPQTKQIVSLAAIDPGSIQSSVAEIMLSDRRDEDPTGDYASVATFVRGDPSTTQVIRSRIKDLIQTEGAHKWCPID